ncbi:hypothetical protein H112_02860 [Trichophyton rubrum D6]|uniref:Uncharacterized protein n=2 Tax=Trichophyton rubrum TaxID=5551 RepID=A0A080WNV1_TRIRC|nr:uncharacterized protein TERG_12292 [Trichophyton rubrum CBS 118892]EZF24640.1 hypothetical protein H100_02865 [Trichophyton rubrum MR850]EZF43586.1 hypothetical protein H102_02857 [Trichophyton rubrum CBS 100081]EZF54429.1 hypothetical protein H103_02872 [Trichophyton rubrum CBS 288.86]EZF64981.1 hypothetical protein H104_02849 [Trichophyton rubrum CBS 289.86]EZF86328.1 hypothetical protein H110_02871 [Trichophyton rubrum MR1448]EZF97055.1 hypothetical protein H113_02871 [Trichophyton rubr
MANYSPDCRESRWPYQSCTPSAMLPKRKSSRTASLSVTKVSPAPSGVTPCRVCQTELLFSTDKRGRMTSLAIYMLIVSCCVRNFRVVVLQGMQLWQIFKLLFLTNQLPFAWGKRLRRVRPDVLEIFGCPNLLNMQVYCTLVTILYRCLLVGAVRWLPRLGIRLEGYTDLAPKLHKLSMHPRIDTIAVGPFTTSFHPSDDILSYSTFSFSSLAGI